MVGFWGSEVKVLRVQGQILIVSDFGDLSIEGMLFGHVVRSFANLRVIGDIRLRTRLEVFQGAGVP